MFARNKTTTLLVLLIMLLPCAQTALAQDTHSTIPTIEFDQEDGSHFNSEVNISGSSTVRLSSMEIRIWNISMPDQWSLIASNLYLDSVVPYTDTELNSTMWSWHHTFDFEDVDCTCYVELSLMEQTDLVSFGIVVYVGNNYHRTVLQQSSYATSYETYSTQIFNTNLLNLDYNLILPPSFTETVASESNILPHVRLCQVANGICLDEYVSLSIQEVVFENELQIIVDVDSNQVADGMYSMQVQIQDQFLTFSNNLTNYILIDQNAPTVRLNSVDSVLESESIVVDIDIDDSYSGSSYVTTWTITEPNGTQRTVSETELLVDNRLEFQALSSGTYRVNALVRDLGGHFVVVNQNISVENVPPTAEVRYDGFLVTDGSTVTITDSKSWVFSANESTDTENDQAKLEYYWFVDGKALLSGQSYLSAFEMEASGYSEIRVEVVDDDGTSMNLSFFVTQQNLESTSMESETTFISAVAVLSVVSIAVVVFLYQRSKADNNSEFVKWTERGEESKN